MKCKRKKRALTILEIMIVIFLIGLIGSVIGANMKGSLDEGKAFKTRQAQEQIKDILMLEVARGASLDDIVANPEAYLENSGLVKKPKEFINDGWNERFAIKIDGNGALVVRSEKLANYDRKKRDKLGKTTPSTEEDAS